MAFIFASQGTGWRLAGSLIQIGTEINVAFPQLTCSGTIGNAQHVAEGTASDHNPFVKDPATGVGIVRAIDISGPLDQLTAIETLVNQLYNARDPRVFEFGYTHMNNEVTVWDDNPATTLHSDAGDVGHLHISVTQRDGNNPSAAGYVAAIDSRASWDIASLHTSAGSGTPVAARGGNPIHGMPVPALIAQGSHQYLGPIHGPAASHGGYYTLIKPGNDERPTIKLWQQFLIWDGDVPGVTDINSGWADGVYDVWADPNNHATSNATTAFQNKHRPAPLTSQFGVVYWDDWTTAASL